MNELKKKLKIFETPIELLYEDPTAFNLKNTPKIIQTYDVLKYVCEKDGLALKHASKKLVTAELCEIAVNQNSYALSYVPKKVIGIMGHEWYKNLCMTAAASDGTVLQFLTDEEKTEDVVETALLIGSYPQSDKDYIKYPVAYVPEKLLTKELLEKVVTRVPLCIRDIPKKRISMKLSRIAVTGNGLAIRYVPSRFISKDMIDIAISSNADAIRYVSENIITKAMSDDCFAKSMGVLAYLPLKYISKEMCIKAIESDLFSVIGENTELNFDDIPEKLRNDIDILNAVIDKDKNNTQILLDWNASIIDQKKNGFDPYLDNRNNVIKPLRPKAVKHLQLRFDQVKEELNKDIYNATYLAKHNLLSKTELDHPSENEVAKTYTLVPKGNGEIICHDLSMNNEAISKFYYISDIHLEHQIAGEIKKEKCPENELSQRISEYIRFRVNGMVAGANNNNILLIGGDVADSPALVEMFYKELKRQWNGRIICVLGNHELWDGSTPSDWKDPNFHARSVDDIVLNYKDILRKYVILLENQIYIKYKNKTERVISTQSILGSSNKDLTEILSNCSLIILGGIGYSGLNPKYNAEAGLYRRTICTIDEDKKRTELFKAVYDKVNKCANEQQVIVMTHNPIYDWSNECPNPRWIYVNGHTHRNSVKLSDSGAINILSDNQVGYKPSKWHLKSFVTDIHWYDPFEEYDDGIYEITSEEYGDFNRGRSIQCNGCSFPGQLFMLKRSNMYMFLLDSGRSLCLMVGGRRKILENRSIKYYFDNMQAYSDMIKKAISPYQSLMTKLSEEIKRFGGSGYIHGCIVDISFFSHIYVNPFDGKVTPYWALDIVSRKPYDNIKNLLEKEEPQLLRQYLIESRNKTIPLIGEGTAHNMSDELIKIPEWVLGTEIYKPSRIMKSIQYIWEQNVIRVWNDQILQNKDDRNSFMIEKNECVKENNG